MSGELLIAAATLIGPIAAVQAQKWIERWRDDTREKRKLFETLMATRGARVSPEHVRALNLIDLIFYQHKKIIATWREYLDALNEPSGEGAEFVAWQIRATDKLINLLFEMSQDVGLPFDRVAIKNGAYAPVAHEVRERLGTQLLGAVTSAFSGGALRTHITNLPDRPAAPDEGRH